MEFKRILEKLKHSSTIISSSITKEIVTNIRHVTETELLDTLEMLQGTVDIEFQIKIISILSACLLFNTSHRDVIIKWAALYDTLYKILSRGLPIKSAVALNFITSLLYEGEAGSRARTLSLRARAALRASGCLAAMTQLFTSCMLYTNTWKALCRCIAEVCFGSEVNQTYCSHLVPLCIQRCLQGNLEVFQVLQSLLSNHKRNTKIFIETDGMAIFNRKEYFRYDSCLQLLNTVIQLIEVEELRIINNQNKIFVNLQNLVQLQSIDPRIRQWTTIILYHLETKLKENEGYNKNATRPIVKNNTEVHTNVDDTQVLFHNIMSEIISCPMKTDGQETWKHVYKMPERFPAVNNKTQRIIEQTNLGWKERSSFNEKNDLSWNSRDSYNDELTFSFLMDETLKYGKSGCFNNGQTNKMNETVLKFMMNSKHRDEQDLNVIEFKPTFVSTPIKVLPKMSTSLNKNSYVKRSFKATTLSNKSEVRKNTKRKRVPKRPLPRNSQVQDSIKQRSMSSRLLEAINESCTTFIKSVRNVFTGNVNTNNSNKEITNITSINNQNEETYCSYSFTKYMQKREFDLVKNEINLDISSEMITSNTLNTCKTCDDTALLKQKFANDDQLKLTVKKLKLGINLYGCDFKRISKTMWPRETYMTPSVLYNLYRKLILK